MPAHADRIIQNIGCLVTVGEAEGPRTGEALGKPSMLSGDAALAMGDGRILATGPTARIRKEYETDDIVDAGGRLATPGLVDCHTHLVWKGRHGRSAEFEQRLAGVSYEEIAREGGGIRSTVRSTRRATVEELVADASLRLDRMLAQGTTCVEAKSGYGLDVETEERQLEAVRRLNQSHAVDLVSTFLGAHEIPDEYRDDRAAYIRLVIDEMLPAFSDRAEFCDIFCEKDVFELEETREILTAARSEGYELKLHVDELHPLGGSELAAELGARSADHLCRISDAGIRRLAETGTMAVLLPGTTFFLGKETYAPARRLIDAGAPVALATDLNPGSSHIDSLPFIVTLACLSMGMTPLEGLTAVTWNAACAIGREKTHGSLTPGRKADIAIWDANSPADLVAHVGANLIWRVFKDGIQVV